MSDTTARNNVQISSAGSNGSGGSTPVQAAPPVPSMLPVSEASRSTGRAAGQKAPMTMESLQSVRTRKQAVGRLAPTGVVAEQPSATNPNSSQLQIQLQLKAQEIEIAHLKKVLEKVSDTCTKPEDLPVQPTQQWMVDRIEKTESANRALLQKTDRLEAMALKREEDKKAVDTILETVPDIKRSIDSLYTWKKTQEAKSMVLRQDGVTLEKAMTTLQGEVANIDSQLTKRIDEQQKTLGSLSSGLNITLEFQKDVKKRDIFHKFDALSEKVTGIEKNESHTYEKTSSIGRDLDQLRVELDKYIGPFKEEHRSTGATLVEQLRSITLEQTKLPRVTEQTSNFKDDAAQLSSEHKKLQVSHKALCDDMSALKSKIEVVEKGTKETTRKHIQLAKDMESLHDHVSKMNISSADTQAPMLTNGSEGARLEQIQTELAEMAQNIATLGEDLGATELTTHDHANAIRTLQEDVPALFKDKLDPFKQAVEQRLETLDRKLEVQSGEVEKLNWLAKAQQAQLGTASRDLHDLKEGNKRLQSTIIQRMATQDAAVLEVTQQLGLKADVITTDNKMDVIRAALRVLQDQYNNITTDELHQRMVHWFVSTYPTAQNLLQDISSLQQDVQRLVQSGNQLQQARANHTSFDARTALAKNEEFGSKLDQQGKQIEKFQSAIAETETLRLGQEEQAKQIESVQAALSGLQSSMHSLNTNSPFAKAEAINVLKTAVDDLGVRVDQGFADAQQARIDTNNELRTSAGNQNDQRVKAEQQIRKSNIDLSNELNAVQESMDTLEKGFANHVAFSKGALGQLREDINTLQENYIEPNKDLFETYSFILVSVAQLQFIVEAMNQKLPGALEFTFKYDLNALALPPPQVEGQKTQNGSASSSGKGKSKQ
ncbi:hypothetical protein N0V83_005352 [Neocucurbitaria cava]|uniref:Uncharacterized protein n=1 Tax=Neocucurbitaria cava TaxID=798079 RepID=A0A9W8Y9X1_9PLEO|nr:hypothetical protein N0V83_005352 [Neocucurbitaria cava]